MLGMGKPGGDSMFRKFLQCALWACAFHAAPALADPRVPSAAELVQPPAEPDPLLSPDGRRIALRQGDGLALIDLSDAARIARPVALAGDRPVEWFRWAGSGRLVVETGGDDRAGGAQLATIEVATGRETPLGPAGDGEVIHIDAAGRYLLRSAHATGQPAPAVERIDLVTGAVTQVVAPQKGVWSWYADPAGVVRAGMGVKGRKSWLLYRSGEGQAFHRSAAGAGDLGSGIDKFVAVQGSDQGYALATGPGGRRALYRYDFRNSRLGALVHANPRVDLEGFQLGADGSLLGVEYVDQRDEVLWFDPAMKAAQREIDAALPGRVNRIVSTGADGRRMLVLSRSPTDPGSFHLHDRGTAGAEQLMRLNPAVADRRLAPMRPVTYRARDGLVIPAYLTLPEGREARGLPLIVMPHGGPFARDDWGYDPWVQYLAAKGYAVLQPNYRGSTGFGRDFEKRGDGEWGRGMQQDLADGVAWLAGQGTIDARRVCIMGASYGGYAAMWAAAREPERYRCAISFAGISDVAAQLAYDRKTFVPRHFRAWKRRIQGKAESLDALSPILLADRMETPILIAHGSEDEVVPVTQSIRLHEALAKRGRAHDHVVYPGEGHDLDDPAHAADFLTRAGAFLDRHNPS